MTTRNLYITIYIYFFDGRLCEVGAVRRGIRIVRRWGLNFSMSGDDGRDNAPFFSTAWRRERLLPLIWNGLCDRRRAEITVMQFTGHSLPVHQPSTHARFLSIIGHWDVSHPLSSELQVWSSSSGNNYHAVHRSISSGASLFLRHSESFYLVSYCEPSCILHNLCDASCFYCVNRIILWIVIEYL